MNSRCPGCQTVYRVDPERIPQGGVRTRCSKCATVFAVSAATAAPVAAAAPSAAAPAPAMPTPPAAPAPTPPLMPTPPAPAPAAHAPTPPAPAPAAPAPTPPPAAAAPGPAAPTPTAPAPAAPPARPAMAAAPATGRPRPVFGAQDPDTRAQRIARALVSDMVVYAGARRDQSLGAGTLKGDFREEILKSWEEYVAQVGPEMAKKSPHFRDALNAILAKGQSIF